MSQTALAGLAGISQNYLSQIESGTRPLDRKVVQVAIASALDISVAQLLGTPSDDDPVRTRALAHVPAIRTAIVELTNGERRTPGRDPDALREIVRHIAELRNATDYASIAPILSDLLVDIGGHNGAMLPELVETLSHARFALKSLGCGDLAREAAQFGVRVAEEIDAPAWLGQARYSLTQSLPPENAALGAKLTARAADALQGDADRAALETYGRLHLASALSAAVAKRADDAGAHLDEATDVARTLGEPEQYGALSAGFMASWFGPTQVDFWRADIAAELGDPGTVLTVAERVDLAAVPCPNRHVYLHTDVARALAADGKRDREAMHALARAERCAPQHFRLSPVSKNMVGVLVNRAKRHAIGEEMISLARRLGLDPL
jgi:transcriptional regulator with XRE-family HTH domain